MSVYIELNDMNPQSKTASSRRIATRRAPLTQAAGEVSGSKAINGFSKQAIGQVLSPYQTTLCLA